ncbi:MAG: hypothetical protein FWB99_07855 [Treponema sp.]|nr:hypothetical protein [Treponema sp.]
MDTYKIIAETIYRLSRAVLESGLSEMAEGILDLQDCLVSADIISKMDRMIANEECKIVEP